MSTVAEVRAVLHGPFRTLALGRFLDAIGSGLTMSLLVVYLAEVRGFAILTASLVLTWMAVVGLAAAPTAGTLTDRFGPRPVILVAILLEASGVALLSQVTTVPAAFAVATVMAVGAAGIWGDSREPARAGWAPGTPHGSGSGRRDGDNAPPGLDHGSTRCPPAQAGRGLAAAAHLRIRLT